ncbi:helix-turn-helix transcriptional regulator [Clostridium aciditolerans]|uniref:HTH luxR-type domain-containing protein n=1 Tax=Clostridium aciditolerans TaxID=339861 RepID=A0A934M2Y6_9CLOT|nr:helix-turn-helix transcriptional regulator [Clostridium aciditolerans]MBI6871123.1 hypothetical protein [Clostridium aciditolerans]
MAIMSEKDWLLVNDIIYLFNAVCDHTERRKRLLEVLRILIPYNCATFYHADMKKDNVLIDPVEIDLLEEKKLSYDEYFYKLDYCKELYYLAKPIVYRENDLIENREKTEYYNDYLMPNTHAHYVVNVNMANQAGLLGHISLARTKGEGQFSERDMFILRLLEPHLTNSLHQWKQQKSTLKNISDVVDAGSLANDYKLTSREQELISLMLEGLNNDEISNKLFISLGTVKKHINNIFHKIGVKNRNQLICLSIKTGWNAK